MSEWWTYRPADFLMFAPRLYWRLFESLNAAWWPLHLLLLGGGLVFVTWRGRAQPLGETTGLRLGLAALAACWLLAAWAFLHTRFAPINWPAHGYALAFALQSTALLLAAAMGGVRVEARPHRLRAGLGLVLWALLLHPLLPLLRGAPWVQAEVLGLAPDPTAIATLGVLLTLAPTTKTAARWRLRLLWIVPLAWCALSAATLATMGSAQAMVPLAALVVAASAILRR
jgi:hypothetical protein